MKHFGTLNFLRKQRNVSSNKGHENGGRGAERVAWDQIEAEKFLDFCPLGPKASKLLGNKGRAFADLIHET